jgi:serine protease AprX
VHALEQSRTGNFPVSLFRSLMKRFWSILFILALVTQSVSAGISVVRSSGITLTGADGVNFVDPSGITLTGADGFLLFNTNGITLTGADGITLTGADGVARTGANGVSYIGSNGITLTGADGITLTGADGITLTGADGITLTGADGTQYHADSIITRRPDGITLTGADGITLTGADGITLTGADGIRRNGINGITLTGADGMGLTGSDGITLTGADGITLTGADSILGVNATGAAFELTRPTGITLTGADGITLTGADGISLTRPRGITLTGADGITLTGADGQTGLQSVDPELAIALSNATDDSSFNAVVVYHRQVTETDLSDLRSLGIAGGTRFRALPMVYVSATRAQLTAVSHLPAVRSIYGNRTLELNSDPYLDTTGVQRVNPDGDLRTDNGGLPVTGRGVTVAVLDTGINAQHGDLAGKVAQNVRLTDLQSASPGFNYPMPVENIANTDLTEGHGTFVSGIIAGSGAASNGRFGGVAPGARLLGLSAGDVNLTYILSGFDYLLDRGRAYNVRIVNCSFSANTVFDVNDPVNVATKMLTDAGVNVVVSAGNSGAGNGTLNPYAAAPWVIGVGATDSRGALAPFSSRGSFGDDLQHPTLVAPGVDIASLRSAPTVTSINGLSSADRTRLQPSELPYYTTASGTSFSAPQVAGAVALMLEANPSLTPADVKDILARTATPLPKYFYHEAGAGMLNTYAAVLNSAFPDRRFGVFRSALSSNSVRFVTTTGQNFTQQVFPNLASSSGVSIPANTVQATVTVAWDLSANDFGLRLFNASNTLAGESNYLNLPGLSGRREKVVLRNPAAQTYRAEVRHTAGAGTAQAVSGTVELTRVEYPNLSDITELPTDLQAQAQMSLATNVMLPEGQKFRPDWLVSRADLCEALLRAGSVPQYTAADPMFLDVRDFVSRNSIESAQSNPSGKLVYDAVAGGRFYPNNSASKLVAAVAFVRAAGLTGSAATATLPIGVTDANVIPVEFRGAVAVALQQGFLKLEGTRFNPGRAITRLELAQALNAVINR